MQSFCRLAWETCMYISIYTCIQMYLISIWIFKHLFWNMSIIKPALELLPALWFSGYINYFATAWDLELTLNCLCLRPLLLEALLARSTAVKVCHHSYPCSSLHIFLYWNVVSLSWPVCQASCITLSFSPLQLFLFLSAFPLPGKVASSHFMSIKWALNFK